LVNGPDDIDDSWFDGIEKVGITSGASTPDDLILAVIDKMKPDEVNRIGGVEEDISFVLPKELCNQKT